MRPNSSGKLVTHSWVAGGSHEWGTLATNDGLSRLPLVSFLDDLPDLPSRRQDSPHWASYSRMIFRYDLKLNPDVAGSIAAGSWSTEGMSPVQIH